MDTRSRRVSIAMIAAACLFAVAGCGSASSTVRHPRATASSAPSPQPRAADVRACAGARAIISHVAADTAQWSSTLHPFDKVIAKRLLERAGELAAQAPATTSTGVRAAVHSTADSFAGVGTAMRSRKRVQVLHAIDLSRVAYKELKSACSFGEQ